MEQIREHMQEQSKEAPAMKVKRYRIEDFVLIADRNADVNIRALQARILIKDDMLHILNQQEEQGDVCVDGRNVISGEAELNQGSVITLGEIQIVYHRSYLDVYAKEDTYDTQLLEIAVNRKTGDDFPHYRRSPRTVMQISEETFDIQSPPAKKEMDKKGLLQIIISPIIMLCITIAMSIIMKRGLYVIISAVGTVMSLIMSITKYVSDRKACREQNEKRVQMYEDYLLKIRKKLYQAKKQEEEAYRYNYPSIKMIDRMVHQYSSRIYERSHMDDDFLCVSVGHRKALASYHIKTNYNEMTMEEDELQLQANELKEQFDTIEEKPVVVDLKKSNLGLVGNKEIIHEQLKLLVAQLTFEHSYHDVELIHIYDEKYVDEFAWLRWYPHCRVHAVNVIGNINSDASRDQILGSVYRIIRERQQKTDENNKVSRYLPHYIFVIDEPKLIMDHAIMEYLGKHNPELGFSIIYTSFAQANLPDNIGTVVRFESSEEAVLVLQNGMTMNTEMKLQRAEDIDFEWIARDLSVLKHESGMMAQIPESVTFFEMYQVERPEDLQIAERWKKNDSHKSLAVPLGLRSKDEYVNLNLHEKAHGPHGLVAGTTGSGKSELIQSYILSLAVNFHPYEVAFLLIDYKGGGMANLFQKLPHLLGTITNLDGAQSMRALASIKSELARRQRVFGEYDVNHINDYNKLYKEGLAKEPIPHLFIISDEFAELKKEQPEFMTELVSAARIGRSLGVHLILATQKPSGVVDDQIWTNSKFRMALKVQNESDSKEILHTPDAANITQAGRAYLQVGNNEIYELFQSAWSGASVSQDAEEQTQDECVYRLNALGQRELINSDLSNMEKQSAGKITQLDVTVNHIQDVFALSGKELVRKPWLPPLSEQIVSPYLQNSLQDQKCLNAKTTLCMEAAVGIVDIPERQLQEEYVYDFKKDGNLALFGAGGFGKSVALTTILMTLAVQNSVEKLHFYVMDLGNSALLPLRGLPHTAEYIGIDDVEKMNKFMRMIEGEIKKRKKLLAGSGAINFDMYNKISEKPLPAMIWCIDNYDVIREINADYESIINQVSRDGVGLGIYMVITASRLGAVRFNVINNFKNKIALYMVDKTDSHSIVGRSKYELDEIRGRALIKQDEVHQMQFYLANDAAGEVEYVEQLQVLIREMNEKCKGERPMGIPMMPESLDQYSLKNYLPKSYPNTYVPVGLDVEHVRPQFIDLSKGKCIVVGGGQSGKTNLLKLVLGYCSADIRVSLIDTKECELYECHSKENVAYYSSAEDVSLFLERMQELLEKRKSGYEEAKAENESLLPKAYYAQLPLELVIIEDWDNFIAYLAEIKYNGIEKLFQELNAVNVSFLVTTLNTKMKGYDAATKWMRETGYGVILGNASEQSLFSTNVKRSEQADLGTGYLTEKGRAIKIVMAKVEADD